MPHLTHDPQAALAILAGAIGTLLEDKDLAYADPSEQAIVGRLAVLLEGKFPGWSVNVEWNRRGDVAKRLHYPLHEDDPGREAAVRPDLIVHRVGQRENLLVVEAKKAANNDFEGDIWKLKGMTEQAGAYGYAAGLHLVVDMPAGVVLRCDVYVDSAFHEGLTDWLRDQLPGPD
ncbi:hypothetical protein [Sphingobium quisquiliarum]|uniref:hypothetical protein n=1 Tax=Sphingobium quisquiliarum TaxID=538379 RepID=UPI00040677EA|nr:hypothetical protein [Sphingobium quisquiliarum]